MIIEKLIFKKKVLFLVFLSGRRKFSQFYWTLDRIKDQYVEVNQ